ncbi:MAG: type I 3-dehydroquinate dehydratase [Blastocatellia bacterium]|nr:type I 3-dehydroquinate dehydratase [Blastocatellia bacterium]
MTKAILVATLTAPPEPAGEDTAALADSARWLEVRADLAGDIAPDWLRSRWPGRLLYSLRSRAEGGSFEGSASQRKDRLLEASRHYDIVDLECDRDLSVDLLAKIPPEKRFVSWHGRASDFESLKAKFEQMSGVGARVYKLVPTAVHTGDELAPLRLLKSLNRSDVVAFAAGQTGFWTRLVAPHLGAPIVFGLVGKKRKNNGEPSISQLMEDYGLPTLAPFETIYGIVGSPISHSLSPRLHNAAYRARGLPALFVPFHADSFAAYWQKVAGGGTLDAMGLSLRGLTVVSPHKEAALGMAGASSPIVERAASTNIFIRKNGIWKADTTDPEGVLMTLNERGVKVAGKKVAVIGCGGSGRAMAAALDQAGADVMLVNRGMERGRFAVGLLGLPFVRLSEFRPHGLSIVVNATPVGRDDGEMPFQVEGLNRDAVVVDLVYGSAPTPLVESAIAQGRKAIDGREVLFTQVRRQFRLMTGEDMPLDLEREVAGRGRNAAMRDAS